MRGICSSNTCIETQSIDYFKWEILIRKVFSLAPKLITHHQRVEIYLIDISEKNNMAQRNKKTSIFIHKIFIELGGIAKYNQCIKQFC